MNIVWTGATLHACKSHTISSTCLAKHHCLIVQVGAPNVTSPGSQCHIAQCLRRKNMANREELALAETHPSQTPACVQHEVPYFSRPESFICYDTPVAIRYHGRCDDDVRNPCLADTGPFFWKRTIHPFFQLLDSWGAPQFCQKR